MGGFVRKAIRSVLAAAAMWGCALSLSAQAGATERTVSMYHVHTRESITITYWRDGHFIPGALKKLNWFLRDWRRNKVIRMDPRAIDLIYKLHEDLHSRKPVQIICGYRSAATNAMLRRIGRHVARRSRHIVGQAIDFRFPDVPNKKVRNLALAYGIGGVGYYGRSGFIHIDTGSVRQWPRLPRTVLASIIRKNRPMIGRGYRKSQHAIMVASAPKTITEKSAPAPRLVSATGPLSLVRLPAMKRSAVASVTPIPRPRPYAVLLQAAARMEVVPASAPATVTNFAGNGQGRDQIGMIIANTARDDDLIVAPSHPQRRYPKVNRSGKGDLASDIRNGKAGRLPTLRPLADARAVTRRDIGRLTPAQASLEGMIRSYGAPVPMEQAGAADPRLAVQTERASGMPPAGSAQEQYVNRSGKGDLLTRAPLAKVRHEASLRAQALRLETRRPLNFE